MRLDMDVRKGLIVFVFGAMGVVLAYAEQIASANGYVDIDAFTTSGFSLVGLQIVTIVLLLLMGTIIAALS